MLAAGIRKVAPLTIAVALLLTGSAAAAFADSVYLKNGNVIRTSGAVIDGDRLVFSQFGKQMAIPLAIVDRVEEDEYRDPEPMPVTAPAPAPATAASNAPDGVAVVETDEETREYWQDRVRAILSERAALEEQLDALRRSEKAAFHNLYQAYYLRPQIEDVLARLEANEQALPQLRREARRNGVPAGWLRL